MEQLVAMHPYAAEGRSERIVHLVIAIAAIVSAYALHLVLDRFHLLVPWWLDTPSVLGFFGLYWKWFDLRLWRSRLLQKNGWLGVPDLRGVWEARVRTSHDGASPEVGGALTIAQSWSQIAISAKWPQSESHSVSAVLQAGSGARQELVYTYVNEPSVEAVDTMQMHRGTSWLRIDASSASMEGHYYSGRGRQEHGVIHLRRAAVAETGKPGG